MLIKIIGCRSLHLEHIQHGFMFTGTSDLMIVHFSVHAIVGCYQVISCQLTNTGFSNWQSVLP